MTYVLAETTQRRLTRLATQAQRVNRAPGLAAGVAHRGRLAWEAGIGSADLGDPSVPLGPDTQFPVASNSKTFTAALVMQLRDAGRLGLEDPVDTHLPGSHHGGVTIRQLLAHASGIAREPVGEVWESLVPPPPGTLVENWNAAERIGPPNTRWHYSNLAYMILGELVARLDGRSWQQSLQARLLDPLELRRTTQALAAPHSRQYYVSPFSDVPVAEPIVITGTMAPAGGLMSTVADLARWHAFLLAGDPGILSADTLEEMRAPQLQVDPGTGDAYGLGLYLLRREDRVWFGHTGGAPGAITAAFTHAESGITGIVLTNNSITRDPAATAVALAGHALAEEPPPLEPWRPGTELPHALAPLVGQWFSEGSPFWFSVCAGRLQARAAPAADDVPPSVFEPDGEDVYRTVSGPERGERLVVRRRPDGAVRQLNWVTYRFTREPLGFAEVNP